MFRELGLTQEEMADRLGVTTPAVNKWEKDHTQPDISLLAPIARLLGITTDTLLSFQEDLTDEEIGRIIKELDRKSAAESLYGFYRRKEEYEKAASFLAYLPEDDPDRKSRHADILYKTGKTEEAFREQEELLLAHLNRLRLTLNALYAMCVEQGDLAMARRLLDKQSGLARLFEMGEFQAAAPALDLAAHEKDVEATERIMRAILEESETVCDFTKSGLFSHLSFRTPDHSFAEELRSGLRESFRDEETYGYMRGNAFWEEITG